MIKIPQELTPLFLLTLDDLISSRSMTLLDRAQHAFLEQRWSDAERHAINVRDTTSELMSRVTDYATSLIYLADIYREVGRLGPALELNERAQQVLKNQPGPKHYHNRAVSDYALGLTHHALTNDSKALHWYDHAKELFDRAYYQWGIESNAEWQGLCKDVQRWLDALSAAITDQAEGLTDTRFSDIDCVPLFRFDDPMREEGPYGLVQLVVDSRTLKTDRVFIGGKVYSLFSPQRVHRLRSNQGFYFDKPHFVVPIQSTQANGEWKEVNPGDLALICEYCDEKEKEQATGTKIGESHWGDFVRGAADEIFFIGKKRRIIGGDPQTVTGKVIAVLRPESENDEKS
jgi:hypothetical protein